MESEPAFAPACRSLGYAPARRLKHDAVSEVWLLEGATGSALLKRCRAGRFLFGIPPRLLAAREVRILRVLAGVPGVPAVLARLDGRTFVRDYVPGERLKDVDAVPPGFFPALVSLLGRIHPLGVAVNDLSKRENILVTPGGEPALFDFQASLFLPPGGPGSRLLGFVLRAFQRMDLYYVYRLQRDHFPGSPVPEPPPGALRKPWVARIRGLGWPYRRLKRLLFGRRRDRKESGEAAGGLQARSPRS